MQAFAENLAKPYILCTGVSLRKVQISISNTNCILRGNKSMTQLLFYCVIKDFLGNAGQWRKKIQLIFVSILQITSYNCSSTLREDTMHCTMLCKPQISYVSIIRTGQNDNLTGFLQNQVLDINTMKTFRLLYVSSLLDIPYQCLYH